MKIKADETQLIGKWLDENGRVLKDEVSFRIEQLIANYLEKIGSDDSGWDTLFRDPGDGRLWELTYPSSGLHGGGPPRLTVLTKEEARAKYKDYVI